MRQSDDDRVPAVSAPAPRKYPQDRYHYERAFFNPDRPAEPPRRDVALRGADRPQESPYAYDEEIILAVNAALAANRPLLVSGPPGTGKSALAADISRDRGWKLEHKVVTGRTEGRDLLWRFDTVRRLRDAHLAASQKPDATARDDTLSPRNYIDEGVLWKAFEASHHGKRRVVLIDEIDKADPDVPNSLLEVLGNGQFRCDETGELITVNDAFAPFIVITTNDERELSRPFRRRCVALELRPPSKKRLLEIARIWGLADGGDLVTAERLAAKIEELSGTPRAPGPLTPNAAEYLDALRACLKLDVKLDSEDWENSPVWAGLAQATLYKSLGRDLGER